MITINDTKFYTHLIDELINLSSEREWFEFNVNNSDPDKVGEYISAISNSAAIQSKPKGYVIWGVDDLNHEIVGTKFDNHNEKIGNELLEPWLYRLIEPKINFNFIDLYIKNLKIVILEIDAATREPVRFKKRSFIRIESSTKLLNESPEKERALWRAFEKIPAELKIAKKNLTEKQVLEVLNYSSYYSSMQLSIQTNAKKILSDLTNEKLIIKNQANLYDITNLGAILIGNNIEYFDLLTKKTIRVIFYPNNNRITSTKEKIFTAGYFESFNKIIEYIMDNIKYEEIESALRQEKYLFPIIAIRELIANMIIHQDIDSFGTNLMIEIFKNRIEFTNASSLLVDKDRIVHAAPKRRNENLARLMHKSQICEERGSGYDKIISSTSYEHFIAPKIVSDYEYTKVILYSKVPFNLISKEDRIRTLYLYVCFKYMAEGAISSKEIMFIFDLEEEKRYAISRLIKEAINNNIIKLSDETAKSKNRKYIPFWA